MGRIQFSGKELSGDSEFIDPVILNLFQDRNTLCVRPRNELPMTDFLNYW